MTTPAERAKQLTTDHWHGYVKPLLEVHGTHPDVVTAIGFHYRSSGVHFYLHCDEDHRNDMFKEAAFPPQPWSDKLRSTAFIPHEEEAPKLHDCLTCLDTAACAKTMKTDLTGKCLYHRPSLRERMMDAKETPSPCDTCATYPCDDLGGKAVKCSNWSAKAPKPAPVALEICPSCDHHPGCKGQYPPTADGSCKGFSASWPLDFILPSIMLDCTAEEAYQKYREECNEADNARTYLHKLIELWDRIQAIQTSIEKGGEQHRSLYEAIVKEMQSLGKVDGQVDIALRAMLMKNAARWRYSDEVNRLIIESNGHRFTVGEADA